MKFNAKKAAATVAGVATAGAAAAAAVMKKKNICPICEAKRLLHKLSINEKADNGYDNGVALTPPMGWSSWNLFASKINEDLIKEIADAMKNSGLLDAGYKYVNIDDCWQSSERDENGKLQPDKATFPHGMKALSEYVNSLGLKLGLYSSNGTHTCEDYPASLRHEAVDADTFAEWGIEYFKYDFCHNVPISEKAPAVAFVEFSKPGETAFAKFSARDCVLKDGARIVREDDCDNDNFEYVKGLCSRNGSFSVTVESDEDCDAVLTLTIKKADCERFLCAKVNEKKEHHLYFPKNNASDRVKRVQCDIKLVKGENTVEFYNPVGSRMDSSAIQYTLMGEELKRASKEYAEKNNTQEKPIVFSLCEWGLNRPWKWARRAGNLWRTTPDIKPFWVSILSIYEFTVRLWKYSSIGGWNDPDMLEVGNGNLTNDENTAHFSLWCMLCAPLILGNDVRKFIKPDKTVDTESKVFKIITNKTMIGINQDRLGVQCRRIKTGLIDVLVKPLENSRVAVCVLNKAPSERNASVDLEKIANLGFVNLQKKSGYKVFDVWEEESFVSAGKIETSVPSHGVKVYIVE